MSATPLAFLTSAGKRAAATVPLTWFTLGISILVCVIVAVLLWVGVARSKAHGGAAETVATPLARQDQSGLRWITVGLMLSAVPLVMTLVWTMAALAQVAVPPDNPGLVLDVTAHQWWWEVRYEGALPSDSFATANEIHIPVGIPVLVRLHGQDVIHSFWVPKLSGKTDVIPGQTNQSWLQAAQPGRYRGQCSEYCGAQHAKMAFEVVAESPAAFARWRQAQLQTAPPPRSPEQTRGLALVEYRCGLCHAVRGTNASSYYGPDLTHLMSRRMIAAGTLPNNPGSLTGWIQAPQGIKPGSLMPNQHLSGPQLGDIRAYLETLQ
ncbi:hypothetical protein ASE00_07680 [Sphingomonas sp. Root710]|uniref:cytochrome c oxidase subunit II n=1 Tax=Sphingomonas sp. Root710 TaxID=1736594 RepID=UPI0006F4CD2F|nr:cytochrome c oxidase subunit II [Sphingomonas sp. Root710]KRB86560.1 hypothetical protein ASE00_07680 [Sphingomonas sp. Root710]